MPEQLESLIGDKRFYQAALLLVRSLKAMNKPEIAEIGALFDLKQYFKSQENVSLYTLNRSELNTLRPSRRFWSKSYKITFTSRPTTVTLDGRRMRLVNKLVGPHSSLLPTTNFAPVPLMDPRVDEIAAFPHQNGDMTDSSPSLAAPPLDEQINAIAGPGPSSRFSRYLAQLAVKPAQDPLFEYVDSDLTTAVPGSSLSRRRSASAMAQASSNISLVSLAVGGAGHSAEGVNPEADSYAYMELLLEALAALGRLGAGLEITAQRVSSEVYALAETTLDEVEDRYVPLPLALLRRHLC